MKYLSVCSGVEAASAAWHQFGWQPVAFAEIEPFPSAVLAHHYPEVPNLGDMTTIAERILSGEVVAPDILVGGTPCQAFSVAGLRNSLNDNRGQLSLTFIRIADAIDHVRRARGEPPCIIVWENVPGVLSTSDNAFGCFLGALAGEDGELEPAGKRWTNAGAVFGPERTIAWRILDAQHFGLAQRRRRVFVVASARDGFNPAAVLFEFDGVRRDTAPSREARQTVTGTIEASLGRSRGAGTPTAAVVEQPYEVGNCLTARMHKGINSTVDEGQTPIIALQDVTPLEKAQNGKGWNDDGTAYTVDTHATQGVAFGGDIVRTLQARHDSSPCADRGMDVVAVATQVRRLTPTECERLQGFPDGYTNIPWRGKPESPDGPRYKALGNSMAVPCMAWIGNRINQHDVGVGRSPPQFRAWQIH